MPNKPTSTRSTSTKKTTATGIAAGTQALTRTLSVLEAFREEEGDLGIADIARRVGMSGSTVHRIVRALVSEEYLAQNEETDRYYLGRASVLLGQAANRRLGLHNAQGILKGLAEETGESVNLGVRDGNDMVVMMRVESRHPLRFSQEPGDRLPVHASGMGKATLSVAVSHEVEVAQLPTPLEALTSNTLVDRDELLRDLERTRSRGFSLDNEEAIVGVRCVATPVLSERGEVLAAVAIQGPAVRMPLPRLEELAPLAVAAADEISQFIPAAHHL